MWVVWLLCVIASFGALEWYAVHTGQPTLSRFIAAVNSRFPLTSTIYGAVVGGLAVHFFWPWCP